MTSASFFDDIRDVLSYAAYLGAEALIPQAITGRNGVLSEMKAAAFRRIWPIRLTVSSGYRWQAGGIIECGYGGGNTDV